LVIGRFERFVIRHERLNCVNAKKLSPKEVDAIRIEVGELKQAMERLKETTKSVPGYRNRIDGGLARIARIEKYLGIEQRMAA
jgi:hypothetical protein